MSIWRTTPVTDTPVIELASWSVYEVSSNMWERDTTHFVGWNMTEREGRVSSEVVEYDPIDKVGKTKSGRLYKLVGSPGNNRDGSYTFSRWCEINKVTTVRDMTNGYA